MSEVNMVSDAQMSANRANAARSTGPRSVEGKERSSRNALRHGFSARKHAPSSWASDRANRAVEIALSLNAHEETSHVLATSIGHAAALAERLCQEQDADFRRRRRFAVRNWEIAQEKSLAKLTAAFVKSAHPTAAFHRLIDRGDGCAFLEDQWRGLGDALDGGKGLTRGQAKRVLKLLGRSHAPTVHDLERGDTAAKLWVALLAISPDLATPLAIKRFFKHRAVELPDVDRARAEVAEFVAGEQTYWSERSAAIWEATDGPDRDEAEMRVATDASKKGRLRQRYFYEQIRIIHICLRDLRMLRSYDSIDECERMISAKCVDAASMRDELNAIHGMIRQLGDAVFPPPKPAEVVSRNEPKSEPEQATAQEVAATKPAATPAQAPAAQPVENAHELTVRLMKSFDEIYKTGKGASQRDELDDETDEDA